MSMILDPRAEFEHYQKELRLNIESGVLPELNSSEAMLINFIRQGMPQAVAARMAGMTVSELIAFRADPRFEITLDFAMTRARSTVEITRDMLNYMALEAHSLSSNTIEAIKALDFMAKLNGLYDNGKRVGQVIEGGAGSPSQGRMRQMTDDELVAQAGFDSLDPVPVVRGLPSDIEDV